MMKDRINRRRRGSIVAAAAVAVASLILGGCATAPPEETGPVTLRLWAWGVFQPEAVEIWNAENPDIQVVVEKIPKGNGGGYAKMHAAILAGNPPDLGSIEFATFPSFMLNDELVDITDYLTEEQVNSYIPWMYEQGVIDGRTYSLPYGSGPMGLFYRTDIFEAAGVSVPTTWEEFAEAAEAIHAADPTKYIASFDPGAGDLQAAFSWQAGAKWFGTDDGSWTVNLSDGASTKVADYWQDLVDRDLVKVSAAFSDTWYKDLQDGNLASWLAPSWGGVTLQSQAPDTAGLWAIADLPQWPGEFTSSNWGGAGTAVFRGSKHPEEAAQFAAWLGGSVAAANVGAKYLNWPAIVDVSQVSNVSVPLDFFGGQTLESVFNKSANNIDTSWKWVPNYDTTNSALSDGLKAAIADGTPFSDAYKVAQEKTIADLLLIGLKAKVGN